MENIKIENAESVTITRDETVNEIPRGVVEINEEGIPKSVAESRAQRYQRNLVIATLVGTMVGAGVFGVVAGCERDTKDGITPITDSNKEEETEIKAPEAIGKEIELDMSKAPTETENTEEISDIRQEIESERSWDFSQTILKWSHEVDGNKDKKLEIYNSPGDITIVRPESAVEDLGDEKVVMRYFNNDEQMALEWVEIDSITDKHLTQRTWVMGTTTDEIDKKGNLIGKQDNRTMIKVDYLDEEGNIIHSYEGKLVNRKNDDGTTSILFLDYKTGELRPASWGNTNISSKKDTPVLLDYDHDSMEVTIYGRALKPGTRYKFLQGPGLEQGDEVGQDHGFELPREK